MDLVIKYDASAADAPAAFKDDVAYVVKLFDAKFTNKVRVNIDVGWGEIDGQTVGANDLGESLEQIAPAYSYAKIRAALIATAHASGDPVRIAAVDTLPTSDPTKGGHFDTGTAEAKALGLLAAEGAGLDGWVGFAKSNEWSYTVGAKPTGGRYYLIGVLEHEITEVMGRDSDLGTTNGYTDAYTPMDLFRYSAPNERVLHPGALNSKAYFSYNNGDTDLGRWNNNVANGDLGDWYPGGPAPGGNDAFNDYSNPDVVDELSPDDLKLMDVIGWNTSSGAAAKDDQSLHSTSGGSHLFNGTSSFSSSSDVAATTIFDHHALADFTRYHADSDGIPLAAGVKV